MTKRTKFALISLVVLWAAFSAAVFIAEFWPTKDSPTLSETETSTTEILGEGYDPETVHREQMILRQLETINNTRDTLCLELDAMGFDSTDPHHLEPCQ